MKSLYITFFCFSLGIGAVASAQDLAVADVGNHIFTGTITESTGDLNSSGTVALLLTNAGIDYSLTGMGLSDPVPYRYEKTGANTGTLFEETVAVELTFTEEAAGNFVARYVDGGTQSGAFQLEPIAFSVPLVNMSTRTRLGAGESAVAGLVIGGTGSQRILLRAVGPGLAGLGVANAMPNPVLTLFRNGQTVARNDNWDANADDRGNLQGAFGETGAFPLTNGSADAAILLSAEPGIYSMVVGGAGQADAGEVLIEVYFVD